MSYPLREEGLQINAVLSMGNSLYAVLVGIIISVITVVVSSTDITVFGMAQPQQIPTVICHSALSLLVLLWIAYYLIDWHDLNCIPFIDENLGMRQMLIYFIAIFAISVCITFAMLGNTNWVAALVSVYCPCAARFRNKVLDRPREEYSPAQLLDAGIAIGVSKVTTRLYNTLYIGVCAVVFLSAGFAETQPLGLWSNFQTLSLACEWILPIGAVAILIIAVVAKYQRSKNHIRPEYRKAIQSILANEATEMSAEGKGE